jgi:hypothetical protein
MYKFLLILSMVFILCYSSNVSSMIEHIENDLEISRKAPLISSVPYEKLVQNENNKMGVITLCFAKQKGSSFDHASLVFEMFLPEKQNEISLLMIHYAMGDGNMKVKVENHIETLKMAHRAVKTTITNNSKTYLPATHKKYASWIISNDTLIKGFNQAKEDTNKKDSYNCVGYVSKIMRIVGLEVNFGWWSERADNLKLLVDKHIKPEPNNKYL